MDRYIYFKSDSSDTYFTDNQVYKFKAHSDASLPLMGFWKIGLTEFYATDTTTARSKSKGGKTNKELYIYTDICKESIVHDSEQPLLRRVEKNTKTGWSYQLNNMYYLPDRQKELLEFTLYLKCEDGSNPSFLASPLHLTFHLKQYHFICDY
jgi:hypothetical protein